MPVLGFVAVVLALGIFLWFAGVHLPTDRADRRFSDRGDRDGAVPVPIQVDRSGPVRPTGEANRPAPRRLV